MGWAPDPVDVAYALAIFILLHSIPSLWSLVTGSWRAVKDPNHRETLYEDEDGVASPESTDQFSNKTENTIADNQVLAAKDVRKTAEKKETDGRTKSPGGCNPSKIA